MASQSPHLGADYDLPAAELEFPGGVPHATAFGDGYYNADDGLAESRHVFLGGNDLAGRMRGAGQLTIAETGFGTGLNLLAVMAELDRHPRLHLDFISFEGFPLTATQMRRAHASFAEVALHAEQLRAALPPRWPGYHLVPLCEGRLSLHLHYGEIESLLPQLDFTADAWFLDGFAPARNPSMWSEEILGHVGRLTRPGGTVASFTAAGDVRRGLAAAGFDVERVPGYGRKRQMIRGLRAGQAAQPVGRPQRVAVIGSGIAGVSAVAGLRRRGAEAVLLDAGNGPGEGASGNRMALQSPRLTVDHNAMSRLSAACLSLAARLSDLAGATVGKGVLALDAPDRMAERHSIFRNQSWPTDLLRGANADDLPRGMDQGGPGIVYPFGRAIAPARLLAHLAVGAEQHMGFAVTDIAANANGIAVAAADGRSVHADAVILASGADLDPLLAVTGFSAPIETSFGQVSHVPAAGDLASGVSFGGYLTPAMDGYHDLGATFTRETQEIATGHAHNLGLLPDGWRGWMGTPDMAGLGARVRRRASLPDRRPLAGCIADRVCVLGGLGARGFTLAPLLGDLLAAEILGHAAPLDRSQRQGVNPSRYLGTGS